ncbi:uncharacterized protein LOC115447777 [Manduca sexta]|uniref:Uncharacterized protein n=1 Tax=Manduca sexta TaxID=7130 RepID=A0A922CRI1_MANSE|nr:uncharacterized protein LOC115447777 [Manduca sexta]KAG6456800.1 hypothetical protein O3G_MSEX009955 [Manduca sexta]
MSNRCQLELLDDQLPHSLLEPPSPAYTNVTVRRAFIVWLHCGQKNKFKDVCNYFHYLESLEEKLPPNKRATSRHHEFVMFTNQPPKSSYLKQYFPTLYPQDIQERLPNPAESTPEKCDLKLEEYEEIRKREGATKKEIIQASCMIRNYCKSHMKSLNNFLCEFKDYSTKCELSNSVNNLVHYIKRKLIEEEICMLNNCTKNFKFFDFDVKFHSKDEFQTGNADINNGNDVKKIKILTNEARHKANSTPVKTNNIFDTFYKVGDINHLLVNQAKTNLDNYNLIEDFQAKIKLNWNEGHGKSVKTPSELTTNDFNSNHAFYNSKYVFQEKTKFR